MLAKWATDSFTMGLKGLADTTSSIQRNLRGSADDIGWLQRDPHMPPVQDGTKRFMEILDSISRGVHRLPKTMVYLLIPGLFSNHEQLYFCSTKTHLSKMGLSCHIAKIQSESSVERNAGDLKHQVEELHRCSRKRVVLLGHSKGGLDAAAAVSIYWHDLKDKVAELVCAQSPYGGTPVASDIVRQGQLGEHFVPKPMVLLICNLINGNLGALEDLTYEKRKEFVKKHPLPKELPVVSFHTEANITPAAMATFTHMANLETGLAGKYAMMMPTGAAMAASAKVLLDKYGEKSDGLVTCRDAEVPGSVVVHSKRKLDHQWMVFSSLNDDPSEANSSEVCEALLQLLIEIGHRKNKNLVC